MFNRHNLSGLLPFYAGAWVLFAAVHFLILSTQTNLDINLAITESIVFNVLPGILGIGLWFLIKFADYEKYSKLELFLRHLGMGAVILFIWFGAATLLMGVITGNDSLYLDWLSQTMMFRLIAGILLYLIMISVFYLLINNQNLAERKIHEEALKNLLHKSELNALRAQIKPHFLFNALNSISSLTITNPQKAQEMVINLSDFMRYSLSFTGEGFSSLQQELNHVRLYLEIEKVRFGDRLTVEENIDEAAYDWALPPMILQPLVENAVKHGIDDIAENPVISLLAVVAGDRLQLSISNSYDPTATARDGTGTGLQNVVKRFAMIYGIHNLVQVEKSEKVFSVNLSIPQNGKYQRTDY